MSRLKYILMIFSNSVGFIFLFGLLVFLQLEYTKTGSIHKNLKYDLEESNEAYSRFINGRALNSDFSHWKRMDQRYQAFQFSKMDKSDYLKGVAVFQDAFWNKYKSKNNQKIDSWKDGISKLSDDLRNKIIKRFPLKDDLNKKLNLINQVVRQRFYMASQERESVFTHLVWQYVIFLCYIFLNLIIFGPGRSKSHLNETGEDNIYDIPSHVLKLENEKIVSYSNLLSKITPNIEDHEEWENYFNANFNIIKNVSNVKIVSLRQMGSSRYKLTSTIKGNTRYVNFMPIVTVVKQVDGTPPGNDSLNETIKDCIHRIELTTNEVKFELRTKNDAFINEDMSERIEDCLNLLGTFYKRISAIDGIKPVIEIESHLDNDNVNLTFSNKKIKMDSVRFRNNSNFNFSFYPQRIEEKLKDHQGKVTIKNKYSDRRNFICSEIQISFQLSKSKTVLNSKMLKAKEMGNFN